MSGLRIFTLVAGIICAFGGALSTAGVVSVFVVGFDFGVNIGAGLLLLAGTSLAIAGAALLLTAGIISIARRRPRTTAA